METLDIWMLPCANPDGRHHVMKTGGDWIWRMNRRDNPGTPCDGVDPNRNCDFMWRVIGPTTVWIPAHLRRVLSAVFRFPNPSPKTFTCFAMRTE